MSLQNSASTALALRRSWLTHTSSRGRGVHPYSTIIMITESLNYDFQSRLNSTMTVRRQCWSSSESSTSLMSWRLRLLSDSNSSSTGYTHMCLKTLLRGLCSNMLSFMLPKRWRVQAWVSKQTTVLYKYAVYLLDQPSYSLLDHLHVGVPGLRLRLMKRLEKSSGGQFWPILPSSKSNFMGLANVPSYALWVQQDLLMGPEIAF